MAKKNNNVVIENVELKPQTIGEIPKKKNNIGRVILIFVAFIFTIVYLPNITVIFNNILGMDTSSSIVNMSQKEEEQIKNPNSDNEQKEINYVLFSEKAKIENGDYSVSNFKLTNNNINFVINNNLDSQLNLGEQKLYLEIYNENKTLINRYKVDVEQIEAKGTQAVNLTIKETAIHFITFVSKTKDDYPVIDLKKDDAGNATLTCVNNNSKIQYTFNNDELIKVREDVNYNFDVTDMNYSKEFSKYQTICSDYSLTSGATASFNNSSNGFTALIQIDLEKISKDKIKNKYYFNYKELSKVVSFEMQTYGYSCR